MISLLIETSTERGVVALFNDQTLIFQGKLNFGLQNSTTLFPEIVKAFDQVNLTPNDLGLIIVGVGPGSYTGIRVAAMTAKTLGFALNIPIVGISSLTGFVPEESAVFASVMDARISGIYLQTGEILDGVVIKSSEPSLISLEDAGIQLNDYTHLVTPNATTLKPKLLRLVQNKAWNFIERSPDSMQMALVGWEKFRKGEYRQDHELDLLYLRKTQAEINLQN